MHITAPENQSKHPFASPADRIKTDFKINDLAQRGIGNRHAVRGQSVKLIQRGKASKYKSLFITPAVPVGMCVFAHKKRFSVQASGKETAERIRRIADGTGLRTAFHAVHRMIVIPVFGNEILFLPDSRVPHGNL